MLLLSLGFVQGCGTRTVYVRDGTPLRLAKDTPAEVWVDKTTKGTVVLPEGGYYLNDPGMKP